MLVTLVNVFVSFVTTSFEIVRSMEDDETLPYLLVFIFVKKSILLTIMFYEPYRLQAEVLLNNVTLIMLLFHFFSFRFLFKDWTHGVVS